MTTFTGTGGNDSIDAVTGTITGFTGGSVALLQDLLGDTMLGGSGLDTIIAGGGNDSVQGGFGRDSINGGGGDDTIEVLAGEVGDDINGGSGTDTLTVATFVTHSVNVNLATQIWTSSMSVGLTFAISNIEWVIGGALGDVLVGDSNSNTLQGGDGADIIAGGGGSDLLNGGAGNDTLSAAAFVNGGGITLGSGLVTRATNANNNSIANAIDVSNAFSQAANPDTLGATGISGSSIPHVTIRSNLGDSIGIRHFYKINAAIGDRLFFDMDDTTFNSALRLFDPSGALVATSDNSSTAIGTSATSATPTSSNDAFLVHQAASSGFYTIEVSASGAGSFLANTLTSVDIGSEGYSLQVSSLGSGAVTPFSNLFGEAGADVLLAGAGGGNLSGDVGADVMYGSAGGDYIILAEALDTSEIIDGGGGSDILSIQTSINFASALVVPTSIEQLQILGNITATFVSGHFGSGRISETATFNAFGPAVANLVIGIDGPTPHFSAANLTFLADWGAEDTITLNGNGSGNALTGTARADTLVGNGGDDTLTGGFGDDRIYGNDFASTEVGGTDLFIASGAVDGADKIYDVEILDYSALGAANPITVSPNLGAQSFHWDIIVSGGNADLAFTSFSFVGFDNITTFLSGAGNDTIAGITGASLGLTDGGAGHDSITSSGTLRGGTGNDTLNGINSSNDTLEGGADADTLNGDTGADIYLVDVAGDTITETNATQATGGYDVVFSTVNYTLTANVEQLVLRGPATIGTGNALANYLYGGESALSLNLDGGDGDDVLYAGLAGGNTLIGGSGIDTLLVYGGNNIANGGLGNDVYFTYTATDTITELGGAGIDTVYANWNFTMPTGIEQLLLFGSANTGVGSSGNDIIFGNSTTGAVSLFGLGGADVLFGGIFNDALDGGSEDDILFGLGGTNTLTGGAGSDVFYVETLGNIVNESAGGGFDTLYSNAAGTTTLAANVEQLILYGAATGGTGAADNDYIYANGAAGAVTLDGGLGADYLLGSAQADVLIGGIGLGTDQIDLATGGNDFVRYTAAASSGTDIVYSFDANAAGGQDLIDIAGLGYSAASIGSTIIIAASGVDTLITFGGALAGTTTTLVGVAAANITAADFVF